MKNVFAGPEELQSKLHRASQELSASCGGCLLPFDSYCMSASLRGMDTVTAYSALAEIDNFFGCCIIARSQLDSLVRLNGVLHQPTPHTLSQRLVAGEKLRSIKGADGQKLMDSALVAMLAKGNPWVQQAYDVLNEFVHLSPMHYKSLMAQGKHQPDGVVTIQYLGNSSYVHGKDKSAVNVWFVKTTEGLCTLLRYWAERRGRSSDTQEWLAKARAAGAA